MNYNFVLIVVSHRDLTINVVQRKRQEHWARLTIMPSNLNLKKAAKECDLSCLIHQISNHSRMEAKYNPILSERITNIYLGKKK